MWIYEPDSLQIKAVNKAAVALYGYTKEEMLSLTIKDLRPDSEIPKLHEEVDKNNQAFNDAGIIFHLESWREIFNAYCSIDSIFL